MIYQGQKVVTSAGTAVPLMTTRTMASFLTLFPIKSLSHTNAGQVRVGGNPANAENVANVSGGTGKNIPSGYGFPIGPGDSSVVWPMMAETPIDLNTVYVDADNSNDGVQFAYGRP